MFYPLKGYEYRYAISEEGIILDTKRGKEVSHVYAGIPQYKYVNLRLEDGKRKLVRLHRLIAIQFLPNPKNLEMVDHINGDKMDNRISNLRWASQSDNNRNMKNNWYISGELVIDKVYATLGKECKKTYRRVWMRVNKYGFTLDEALDIELKNSSSAV